LTNFENKTIIETPQNLSGNIKMTRFIAVMLACTILLTAFGCGRSGPVSIHGIVSVDGQPLERGKIDFQPADNKGPTAAAAIQDGKYECEVMPGTKTVSITGGKVTGKHPFTPGNPASPMVEELKSLVPACYNTESTLSCDVIYGTSLYDFKLKTNP
jgi:hypothetical protein